MRIRRQASAFFQFAAEILQLLFRNAAFEISPRVHAGRSVALEVNQIAVSGFRPGLQEMIERNFVQRGRRGKGGNVSADAALDLVGPHHHGQGVPAHQALDAALHFLAAGKGRLLPGSDSVLVRGGGGKRKVYAGGAAGVQRELLQQASCALRAALRQNIVQRIQPLPGFENFHSIGRLRLSHVWFSPSMNAEPSMIVNCAEFCWRWDEPRYRPERDSLLNRHPLYGKGYNKDSFRSLWDKSYQQPIPITSFTHIKGSNRKSKEENYDVQENCRPQWRHQRATSL